MSRHRIVAFNFRGVIRASIVSGFFFPMLRCRDFRTDIVHSQAEEYSLPAEDGNLGKQGKALHSQVSSGTLLRPTNEMFLVVIAAFDFSVTNSLTLQEHQAARSGRRCCQRRKR